VLHTTKAIVFGFIRYGETSIICKMYTELFGVQSYMVNSVRTAKGQAKIAYYQPLSLLSIVAYHKQEADINRISQVAFAEHGLLPSAAMPKTTIRLFLSEMLARLLQEHERNSNLFEYVWASLLTFEHMERDYENFHVQFMLGLAWHLGFGVSDAGELFNQVYKQGISAGSAVGLTHSKVAEAMQKLIDLPYTTHYPINGVLRRELLDLIIRFYKLHLPNLPSPRSIEVLHQIFS
jgi:DNA repair protein RecO (recombination protein O)